MLLTNLIDYMNDEMEEKFHIPEFEDESIFFPYHYDETGMVVDSRGCPAIFTADMLNSYNWEFYKEKEIVP